MRESGAKWRVGWACGQQMRIMESGASPTWFCHEGTVAQMGFNNHIMPSNSMGRMASAAGLRLVGIKHLDILQICKINRKLVY
jgi:hypothetical protein